MAVEAQKPPTKRSTDWDAVHRDYRTGKFTDRELAAKYGVSHVAIGKMRRKHDWQKDLTEEIRQATNAMLVRDLVAKEVSSGSQEVTNTVLAAAELNAQIIRSHKKLLGDLADDLQVAREKIKEVAGTVMNVRDAATYAQAVGSVVGSAKALIEQERKAFGLDEDEGSKDDADALLSQIIAGE